MIKKIFLIVLTLVLYINNSNAQSVSYKVIYDAPKDYKPVSISIEPLSIQAYLGNYMWGGALRAEAILFKRLHVQAEYRQQYGDIYRLSPAYGSIGLGKNLKRGKSFEINGTLFLLNRLKNKKIHLSLSSSKSGNTTSETYINVPGTKYVQWGVKGGFAVEQNNFEIDKKDDIYYLYSAVNVNNDLDTLANFSCNCSASGAVNSRLTTTPMSVGLHRRGVTYLSAMVDGYYKAKKAHTFNDVYFDVMITPILKTSNIDYLGSEYKIVTDPLAKGFTGWRFGWVYRKPGNTDFSLKIELGKKPGLLYTTKILPNAYLYCGIGINIPMTIKALQNIGKKKKEVPTETPTTN